MNKGVNFHPSGSSSPPRANYIIRELTPASSQLRGISTTNDFASQHVVRHHATRLGLILALVAWCRTTRCDAKLVFRVNRPDGLFSNQNPNLGKFWRDLEFKRSVYSLAIWNILQPFGTFLAIW
jgi:hypothetical protein